MDGDGLSKQSRAYLDQWSGFDKSPQELADLLSDAYLETGDLREAERLVDDRLWEGLVKPLVDRLNQRPTPPPKPPPGWASFDQWLRHEDATRE